MLMVVLTERNMDLQSAKDMMIMVLNLKDPCQSQVQI